MHARAVDLSRRVGWARPKQLTYRRDDRPLALCPALTVTPSVGLCVAKAQFEFKSGPNVPLRPHLDIPRNEKVATLDHEQVVHLIEGHRP
jgi:hypothetical protein